MINKYVFMFKELIQLIKWLFSGNPNDYEGLELVQMKYFPFKNYSAMSWCGRIITREPDKIDDVTINHETIHLKQAQCYGTWFSYYLRYCIEWLKGNPFTKPFRSAYYTIPYEVEAYANENDFNYTFVYNPDLIRLKYNLKNRKKLFKSFKTLREWKQYIKTL